MRDGNYSGNCGRFLEKGGLNIRAEKKNKWKQTE